MKKDIFEIPSTLQNLRWLLNMNVKIIDSMQNYEQKCITNQCFVDISL